MLFYVTVPITT